MTWVEIQEEHLEQVLIQLNRQMRDLDLVAQRQLPRDGFEFYQDNVAANQTDVELNAAGGTQTHYLALRAGFVISFGASLNDDRTAGTATFVPAINGTPISTSLVPEATIEINATDTRLKISDLPQALATSFVAGNRLSIKVTTDSSWAPTTADVVASMLVRYNAED